LRAQKKKEKKKKKGSPQWPPLTSTPPKENFTQRRYSEEGERKEKGGGKYPSTDKAASPQITKREEEGRKREGDKGPCHLLKLKKVILMGAAP